MKKLFIILGNQLFNPKYFEKYRDHILFLAEDHGLCSYELHHKQKILLFLSAMRSFSFNSTSSAAASFFLSLPNISRKLIEQE